MADGVAGSKPTIGTIGTSVELISRNLRAIGESETVNSFKNLTLMDVQVKGRVLPSLIIDDKSWKTHNGSRGIAGDGRFCVYLVDLPSTPTILSSIKEFIKKLITRADQLGLGSLVQVQDCVCIRTEDLQSSIESSPTKFNYVIMPVGPCYFGIVKMCEKDGKTKITQCITYEVVEKVANVAYGKIYYLTLNNIVRRTNYKMGGTNWKINQYAEGLPPSVFTEQNLIIGSYLNHFEFDVIPNKPSIATVVGCSSKSLDSGHHINRVLPIFPDNDGRKTKDIKGLASVLKEILTDYRKENNTLPKRIIYFYLYEDQDANFTSNFESKLQGIQDACLGLYQAEAEYQPLISIVMCSRQHKQYFEKVEGGKIDPGTVVDSGVTSPYYMEYYLYSGSECTDRVLTLAT
eukprot:sb/3465300/